MVDRVLSNPIATLAAERPTTASKTYTITQADIDAGEVTNALVKKQRSKGTTPQISQVLQ
jgi:hypothetical protein